MPHPRRRGHAERERKALEQALTADPADPDARSAYRRVAGSEALADLLRRAKADRGTTGP